MARSLGKFALSAGMAHINVGANETPFDVHVELLCNCSPYFDSLFGDRTENPISNDPICFPDDDPDVFAEMLGWMYYGDTTTPLPSSNLVNFLLELWVLAGKLEIPRLQNHVMELCLAEFNNSPGRFSGSEKISYVYTHTSPQSPLRLLVVDSWVETATQACFLRRQEHLPRPFLEDLCSALFQWKECPILLETAFDKPERYFIKVSPPKDKQGDFPETATPEQLKNRTIKRPSSRFRKSASPSSSHAVTPTSTGEKDPKSDLSREMDHLRVR